MTRLLIPVLIASSIISPVVWAQPASQPVLRELPKGQIVTAGSAKLKAYTLEEFKIVLHIYTDYRVWGIQIPKFQLQVDNLTKLSQNQSHQLSLRAEEVRVYQDERKLLTEKFLKENKLRHECENKPNFGSWIAWGSAAAGAVAAVLAGILIARD